MVNSGWYVNSTMDNKLFLCPLRIDKILFCVAKREKHKDLTHLDFGIKAPGLEQ